MKRLLFVFLSLAAFALSFSSCATIVGGAKYNARVRVQDHPDAKITVNGQYLGNGEVTTSLKRRECNQVSIVVQDGDDEPQKSTDQTLALMANYPDLKVICAPTTVGIAAAAKVLQDSDTQIKLTGLGLPSEMAEYIGADDEHSCPYMFLWNPLDVGRLGAYTSIALINGDITGEAGETFTAGDMGDYEIVEAADGGTEVILGAPYRFDETNIEEWASVY